MKKLLLTVSTLGLLFTASTQVANAWVVSEWFKGTIIKKSDEESASAAEEVKEHEEGTELPRDNEAEYVPYNKGDSSYEEVETQENTEESNNKKPSSAINISPDQI